MYSANKKNGEQRALQVILEALGVGCFFRFEFCKALPCPPHNPPLKVPTGGASCQQHMEIENHGQGSWEKASTSERVSFQRDLHADPQNASAYVSPPQLIVSTARSGAEVRVSESGAARARARVSFF